MPGTYNALVTGTSRGLGFGLVNKLLSLPETNLIFATGRSDPTPELQKSIDSSSGRVIYMKFDPVEISSVHSQFDLVKEKLAGTSLDLLINNVGAMPITPKGIATMDDLTSTFNVNVLATHNVTSVFLPLMENSTLKKVVNISTTLGSIALSPIYKLFPAPAYKITKAAMNMLTVQYALEYAQKGFIFLAISPGWIKTDLGGDTADLTVEESAIAVMDVIEHADKEYNGKFYNVHVKGWEDNPGLNQYAGGIQPW